MIVEVKLRSFRLNEEIKDVLRVEYIVRVKRVFRIESATLAIGA